jgi:hypothetical protein
MRLPSLSPYSQSAVPTAAQLAAAAAPWLLIAILALSALVAVEG